MTEPSGLPIYESYRTALTEVTTVRRRFQPVPDEQIALVPPGRQPPTAVGVATPPPRDPEDDSALAGRVSLIARIAEGQLGCLLTAAGLATGAVLPLGPIVGAGLVAVGTNTVCRAITGLGVIPWLRRRSLDHRTAERRRRRAA